jgi:hypothetical protein
MQNGSENGSGTIIELPVVRKLLVWINCFPGTMKRTYLSAEMFADKKALFVCYYALEIHFNDFAKMPADNFSKNF